MNANTLVLAKQATLLALVLAVLLTPRFAQAALLREMYVNASSPLFAEVPVCLNKWDEKAGDYDVEIVGNELMNKEGRQPFIENLDHKFDQINNLDAIITVTSEMALPENLQLIITLLDKKKNGAQEDSKLYSGFTTLRQTPDEFECEQFLRITEQVITTPEPTGDDLPFLIDIIDRDTWRNIAIFTNASWYNDRFTIEQVMASLYRHNLDRPAVVPIIGSMYALPERLEIPTPEFTEQIDRQAANDLAKLLDGSGAFKVERRRTTSVRQKPRRDLNKEEIAKLRAELEQLRDHLALLTSQLSDSSELLQLRDDELRELQEELKNTRGRISELEKTNLELQNRGIGYYLKQSLKTPWPWLLLLLVAGLFVFLVMSAHQRRQDYMRLVRQVNQRDRDDADYYAEKKKL